MLVISAFQTESGLLELSSVWGRVGGWEGRCGSVCVLLCMSLWVYSGFESSRVILNLEQNRERVRIQVWSPLWFRIGIWWWKSQWFSALLIL